MKKNKEEIERKLRFYCSTGTATYSCFCGEKIEWRGCSDSTRQYVYNRTAAEIIAPIKMSAQVIVFIKNGGNFLENYRFSSNL